MKWLLFAFIKGLENGRESGKSQGNFEMDIEWQSCYIELFNSLHAGICFALTFFL